MFIQGVKSVFTEDSGIERILRSTDTMRILLKSFDKDSYDRDVKVLHSLHLPGMHP